MTRLTLTHSPAMTILITLDSFVISISAFQYLSHERPFAQWVLLAFNWWQQQRLTVMTMTRARGRILKLAGRLKRLWRNGVRNYLVRRIKRRPSRPRCWWGAQRLLLPAQRPLSITPVPDSDAPPTTPSVFRRPAAKKAAAKKASAKPKPKSGPGCSAYANKFSLLY